MNYFTRQRYLALQERGDDAMDTADAAWDEAVARYEPQSPIGSLIRVRGKGPSAAGHSGPIGVVENLRVYRERAF